MNLDRMLGEAAQRVADQVDPPTVDLDAVRSRAGREQRRRATAVLAVAVAVLAAVVGLPLLADRGTTAPMPVGPPPTGILILPDSDCAQGGCLEPGTYALHLGQSVGGDTLVTTLTVPTAGWDSNGFQHQVSLRDREGAVALGVYRPHEVAGPQPCDAEGASTAVPSDATVDDVARLLSALPQLMVVDGPRAVPAFGRDARYLQVQADHLTCPDAVQYNLADIRGGNGRLVGGDSDIETDQPVLIEFWVVDVEGRRIVVEARQEGSPGDALTRQLDDVRGSLTFGTLPQVGPSAD